MGAWYPSLIPSDLHAGVWAFISESRNDCMKMETRKCEYCGNEYVPTKKRQRFCSDRCRVRSFRKAQQDERREERRSYHEAHRQIPRYKVLDASDPRVRLVKLKSKGIVSEEYWSLFQECDLRFYGGAAVVNGISTRLDYFALAVVQSIDELGIVSITSEKEKENEWRQIDGIREA